MPTLGNLGTMFVRDERWNLVPVPVIRGDDGLTPYIGENGNWWIGETDTGALADNQKFPVSASIFEIGYSDKPSDYYLEILLKNGDKIRVKLPFMGMTPDDVVQFGRGEPSEWDNINYKQFYVDRDTGLLYINTRSMYPHSYIRLGTTVLSGTSDPDFRIKGELHDLYINTESGAVFIYTNAWVKIPGTGVKAVQYTPQSLTEPEQAQARSNIDAASPGEVLQLLIDMELAPVLMDDTGAVLADENGILLNLEG